MKYIYIIGFLLTTTIITVMAQGISIFSKATQSAWYPAFLHPVIDSITRQDEPVKVLDIGTGPGTLPQLLIERDSSLQVVGIDIDSAMIDEARRRFAHPNVSYLYQSRNGALDFEDKRFDVVTFCSVLFLLDDDTRTDLMKEAVRVLKPTGKIIILTPSGKKSILSSFVEVWEYPYSNNNFTFPIWKIATTGSARKWQQQGWLENYAQENRWQYQRVLTFNDNATIEIISNLNHD